MITDQSVITGKGDPEVLVSTTSFMGGLWTQNAEKPSGLSEWLEGFAGDGQPGYFRQKLFVYERKG